VPEIVDVRDPTKRLRVIWDKAGVRSRCVRFVDNDTMLVGCGDGAVRVIDVATGQIRSKFTAAPGEIYAMDVAPKLGIVATGHTSGAIRLHKYATGELVCELPKASHRVEGLAFNRDATLLACTGNSQFVTLYQVSSGQVMSQLEATTDAWSLAISPAGDELAVGTYEGTVELFDLQSLSRKAVIKAHAKLVPGIAYSPHPGVLASCSEDGGVKLWDTRTLRELLTLSPKANEFVDVAFDPTGRFLGATNARQFSALFDLESMDGAIKANADYHRQRLAPADASEP
jgi:WD40 repeat protein